jgi:hypothetical protein
MNQTAMGYMIEAVKHPAVLKEFRTVVWNAVDCDWKNVDESTRFVHIKGKLRKCIHIHAGYPYMQKIMDEWYSYDGQEEYAINEIMPWDLTNKVEPSKKSPKRKRHQRIHNV